MLPFPGRLQSWLPLPVLTLTLGSLAAAQVQFTEVTVAAGLLPTTKAGVVTPGMRPGAAAGDFNRDGFQDLFVLGGNVRSDQLFINNGDGTFRSEGRKWGIARVHRGGGISVGDYDGDGWLDVFISSEGSGAPSVGQHLLWHNNGNGTFSNLAKQAGVGTTSRIVPDGFGSCFGDYDLDGDLDLLVTSWKTFPVPSLGNKLFRNRGNGTFEDYTLQAGLDIAGLPGFSPTFVDMNGDLYPELLLASDFGTSRYFINKGDGTFLDGTQKANTSYESNGMGSTVGDFNNDGLIDWFVTSVDAGGGDGNKLYFNRGNHTFRELAVHCGVGAGGWGWGTVATDIDLDGWLDIVETNGWANSTYDGNPARLWLNNQDLTFSEVAAASGFDHDLNGLGMVRLDYDEDGDQDILITTPHIGQLRLYRNDQTTGNHWLRIRLDTSGSPGLAPDGYGARVELRTGTDMQVRVLDVGCNYLSTSEPVVSFGLEDAVLIDELVVYWNDGTVTKQTNLSADQLLVVKSY